jgi:dinuclear metal center YbgI/SA1388 family protein
MASVALSELVGFLDDTLNTRGVRDDSRNGLQVEGHSEVRLICLAVDACLKAADLAADQGAEFLLVHHGLFWGAYQPLVGRVGSIVRRLHTGGISLYASHLPLDIHPEIGNNATWAKRIGLESWTPLGESGLGIVGSLRESIPLELLAEKACAIGPQPGKIHAFGKREVQRVAVVTGSGTSLIQDAVLAGSDCLLTGEPRHQAFHEAEELGLNVIYAGHYATETLGLKALGQVLTARWGVPIRFLDLPTGL